MKEEMRVDPPMKRRQFLQRILLGGAGVGALWIALQQSTAARFIRSALSGDHHVDHQKNISPFTVRNLADTPSVRCFAIGDWGTGDAFQRRVAAAMASAAEKEKPQFIISTGDNIYPNGISSVQDKQLQAKWRDVYNAPTLKIPWYVALGNHDYRQDPDAEVQFSAIEPLWRMPARYFQFHQERDGIHATFFVIDTEMLAHGSDADVKKQCEWLNNALASCGPGWKIVVGHHPIRSHGAYGDQRFMLKLVKPLLDRHGVHLYLNGHDHDMQYLKAEEDSFVCIISGGGGGSRDTSYGVHTRFASTNGGFVSMAITATFIHVKFMDSNAKILFADDAVVVEKK